MTTDKRPLTMRSYKPKQPKKPDLVNVELNITFVADGKPVLAAPLQAQMPRLPATQDVMQIGVTLDAKMLMAALEQQMGPASRLKLWTPG